MAECAVRQFGQRTGQGDADETSAVRKGVTADGQQSLRKFQRRQAFAVAKRIGADIRQRTRERNGNNGAAAVEGGGADAGDALFNNNGGNAPFQASLSAGCGHFPAPADR